MPSLEVVSVDSLDESGFDGVVKTHVVVIRQLACVGTFIEAVGQGSVRFGSLDGYAVGKLSGGSGCKDDGRLGHFVDGKLSCPAVVDNFDSSNAILGVVPPLQDGFPIKSDFAKMFCEKIPCSLRCTGRQQRGDC